MINHYIIFGPQGSGKSLRARQLAASFGAFREFQPEELSDNFAIGVALRNGAKTLIIDGVPLVPTMKRAVLPIMNHRSVEAHAPYVEPALVPSPRLIFCVSDRLELQRLLDTCGRMAFNMETLT